MVFLIILKFLHLLGPLEAWFKSVMHLMVNDGFLFPPAPQVTFSIKPFCVQFELHIKPFKQVQYKMSSLALLLSDVQQHHNEREPSWMEFRRTNSVGICPKLSIDTSSFLLNKTKLCSQAGWSSIKSHLCLTTQV